MLQEKEGFVDGAATLNAVNGISAMMTSLSHHLQNLPEGLQLLANIQPVVEQMQQLVASNQIGSNSQLEEGLKQ
eukprot:7239275-Pyramimonas_sp.AAC.1